MTSAAAWLDPETPSLPAPEAQALRLVVVVTPDMRSTHRSIHPSETNANFGFILPWWDRLLGTYRPQPRNGNEGMTIGIDQGRTLRDLWLDRLLVQPFHGPASRHPVNRREDGAT